MPSMEEKPKTLDLAAVYNEQPGDLTGVDCPVCRNKGYVARLDECGGLVLAPCKCQVQRRASKRLEESGLGSLVERCTFETYRTPEAWQQAALSSARAFAADPMNPATPVEAATGFIFAVHPGPARRTCAPLCASS